MRVLNVRWQRLVKDDRTCDRCGATGKEVERAVGILSDVLRPLGIEPRLEVHELDAVAFSTDPGSSNRLWIAGKALEEWIAAEVGSSPCSSVCGESKCRTVHVSGTTFEAIPERLILKAALIAAADMLTDDDGSDSADVCSCQEQPVSACS
jgi:hypothetical protein